VVSDVIDEVVATMILWNNVCTASPYLDDVRSGASKGLGRVCLSDFVVVVLLLQILAFGVLFQMEQLVAFRCGDLDLFFWSVLQQGLASSRFNTLL
jgi:hypothetical protein